MRDAPDRAVAVLAHQQCAVLRDGDADRAGPNSSIADHEAGQEILVFAGGLAVLQEYPDDFVAGPLGAVPRAVEGREDVAAIFGGKLHTIVEGHLHRSRMRLHQDVRHCYPAAQSRLLPRVAGILVGADVEPRPAIEGAFAYPSQKIGRELVAEAVTLVDRAPEVTLPGLHRHPDTVPQAGREEPFVFSLRREGEHDGATLVRLPRRIDPTIGGVAA